MDFASYVAGRQSGDGSEAARAGLACGVRSRRSSGGAGTLAHREARPSMGPVCAVAR